MRKTKLMGILNATPDSFYDQGRFFDFSTACARGKQIEQEGADLIDIGGESARPGSQPISLREELDRVIPIIQVLHQELSIPVSIDTQKAKVAEKAVAAGASFLNDVSGFCDPDMQKLAADLNIPICIMHMQNHPQNMQQNPQYSDGVVPTLLDWFKKRIDQVVQSGVTLEKIYLDPGIGFGKTVAHNVEIIQNLPQFKAIGFPLLLGTSRKSFMGMILNKHASNLLPSTLAVNTLAILAEVAMIRVHDVQEHRDIIDFLNHYLTR